MFITKSGHNSYDINAYTVLIYHANVVTVIEIGTETAFF